MSEGARVGNYIFWLAVLLIIVAYWAGANQLLKTGFSGVNTLDLTVTGRDSQGQFASYPAGGPS